MSKDLTKRQTVIAIAAIVVLACLTVTVALIIGGDTAAAERFAEKAGESLLMVAAIYWFAGGSS